MCERQRCAIEYEVGPYGATRFEHELAVEYRNPPHAESRDPSKTYTSTRFDVWRFVDGKADAHWDGFTKR